MNREIMLILHNIRSAYNVGSIFRTADGAGASKIYLCGYSPIPERNANPTRDGSTLRALAISYGTSLRIRAPARRSLGEGGNAANREFPNAKHESTHSSNKIHKTALGAEKIVPWEYQRQTWRLLQKLKKEGVHIIALELTPKSKNLFTYHLKPGTYNLALLVGHERRGLSPTILEYVDEILQIPMKGNKESLNVSVATGIALYHLMHDPDFS